MALQGRHGEHFTPTRCYTTSRNTICQSDGIAEVADAVEGLGNAIRALRMSSDEVHQTAARLGHLVGQFQVS